MPNAGLPERVGGRLVYTTGPEYFAAYASQFLEAGVRIVGGCCGTGPAHISAMRAVLDRAGSLEPSQGMGRVRRRVLPGEERITPSRLASQLTRREFAISVELTPPRGIDPRRMLEAPDC
jgi:homocysteine S-methyltransferase